MLDGTCPRAAANKVDRRGDDGWVAENAVVAKSGSGQQFGIRPRTRKSPGSIPTGLVVLAVMDDEQRRGVELGGHRREVEVGQSQAESVLDTCDELGPDPGTAGGQ